MNALPNGPSGGLSCWKCGSPLHVPLPIGRRDDCPSCHADLHVCRQCAFYDLHAAKSCREPMADETSDKERGNFCDYFRATPRGVPDGSAADAAKAQLDALFGGKPAGGKPIAGKPISGTTALEREAAGQAGKAQDEAAASREKLERLFGKKS
jgi:hypothetical protein